ncbi:hypothetical protein [Clostridium sp. C2-6-12]|uniref:hypothetical protein n=1 Tax=Clostridium sp. C2-6-12 TaxID=2698832 RepID=UPI001A9AE901|nr:hypothetical protein [Clostridium sp. C2-6-12]
MKGNKEALPLIYGIINYNSRSWMWFNNFLCIYGANLSRNIKCRKIKNGESFLKEIQK